jgi:F0F1-type ATP synthase gamma subunit
MRLKSIRNIAKITKTMKMIASTRVTKAQRLMETARAYGMRTNGAWCLRCQPMHVYC